MKRRNPLAAWLGLPLITLGIYHLVWHYKIHKEMGGFDRRRNVPTAGPMLVLLLLSWTIVAPLVSCSALAGLLLMFVFGLGTLYYQAELNKVVDRYQVPEGNQIPYTSDASPLVDPSCQQRTQRPGQGGSPLAGPLAVHRGADGDGFH